MIKTTAPHYLSFEYMGVNTIDKIEVENDTKKHWTYYQYQRLRSENNPVPHVDWYRLKGFWYILILSPKSIAIYSKGDEVVVNCCFSCLVIEIMN